MVSIKPFSGLYYYNKLAKANNVSRFVKKSFKFDDENLNLNFKIKNEFNVEALQNFNLAESVNSNFKKWLKNGVLTVSGGMAFYVCEISYKIFDRNYSVKGVFASLKLPENDECEILNVERSVQKNVDIVLRAFEHLNFQPSAVFALYSDEQNEINAILKEMSQGVCFEKAKHSNVVYKLWEVVDEKLNKRLQTAFEKLETLILVGGSEIFDAALINKHKNRGFSHILTFFIEKNSDALAVLPFHRVLSMENFNWDVILKNLCKYFDYSKCKNLSAMQNVMFNFKRNNEHAFGVYAEETFGVLKIKDAKLIESNFKINFINQKLAATILDEIVFKHLIKLNETNTLQFTSSAKVAKFAVDSGDGCLAFFLNSERLNDLFEMAKLKTLATLKSAEIFPRPVDGLVFCAIE